MRRLSRIFVDTALETGLSIALDTARSHYIRQVLRLQSGANIVLFNAQDAFDYQSILHFDGKKTFADIQSAHSTDMESNLDSEIIQGLSRSDHLNLTIQKCTELGISRLSIFNAEHSDIPLKKAQQQKRLVHWKLIALKACEQCGRHRPPAIHFYSSLAAGLASPLIRQNKLMLDPQGQAFGQCLLQVQQSVQFSILVGPEGGLAKNEIHLARENQFIPAGLGPRILRTETAAIAALAILQSLCGDHVKV